MKKTEQWLEEKIQSYRHDKEQTLEDMLVTTTDVIQQYLNSPNTATKGVLEACVHHNNLFFKKANIIES